jgi:hypothetical protein
MKAPIDFAIVKVGVLKINVLLVILSAYKYSKDQSEMDDTRVRYLITALIFMYTFLVLVIAGRDKISNFGS